MLVCHIKQIRAVQENFQNLSFGDVGICDRQGRAILRCLAGARDSSCKRVHLLVQIGGRDVDQVSDVLGKLASADFVDRAIGSRGDYQIQKFIYQPSSVGEIATSIEPCRLTALPDIFQRVGRLVDRVRFVHVTCDASGVDTVPLLVRVLAERLRRELEHGWPFRLREPGRGDMPAP